MDQHEPTSERRETYLAALLLLVVAAVVLYVRIRLLAVPLERDEGEFAYMGQLLLKGIPPYINAYTMKLPGASAVYALFMVLFGQSPAGIHLGLLLVNGVNIFLVYLLARRLFDHSAALASCGSYALLSLSQSVYGIFAHATHFVILFFLTGFVLLLRSFHKDKGRMPLLFVSGICFGLSFIMKQHAALLAVFAMLYYLRHCWKSPVNTKKHLITGALLLLAGMLMPYLLLLLGMATVGAFDTFWFWTVRYARQYVTDQTTAQGLSNFLDSFGIMLQVQWALLLLALLGGIMLWKRGDKSGDRFFVVGFLFFSFLAICPGLLFRRHYFVMLLPGIALLIGAAANTATTMDALQGYRKLIPTFLLAAAIACGLYQEKELFFELAPSEISRASYDENPFPEALQIADYIKNHSSPSDRIAVLGSEPEIYFYADRLSATGHIYMYGLMEPQPYSEKMQLQMIREIEAARPVYIVDVNVHKSWLKRPSSATKIFEWKKDYLRSGYDTAGIIDIVDSATSRYMWGVEAVGYTPVSKAYLTVFKRKAGE
jgi:hypothetical protein